MATKKMKRYRCTACGYIYDPLRGEPKNNIVPGTAFEDLPGDYVCPVCGVRAKVGRTAFVALDKPSRYRCVACDYIYDPERGEPKNGIKPGTMFEDLPESYTCPVCGAYAKVGKTAFVPLDLE
jgi:rubredoxin